MKINLNVQPTIIDDQQSEAVNYLYSTYIEAGPGSGKTRCLTMKAFNLWQENQKFIALTFTVRAANEMKFRLDENIEARTIHSFCLSRLGQYKGYKFAQYEDLLYDFLDIKRKPKFDWILVDEVQDLSPIELDIVKSISTGHLFGVGDVCQSIYDFPGADAVGDRIEDFLGNWNCTKFKLHNNYRSTEEVVDRLNKIYKRKLVAKEHKNGNGNIDTTAILTRTNKEINTIDEILRENSIKFARKKKGTKFPGHIINGKTGEKLFTMTNHCCKGLEFNNVIILAWNDMQNEKNLYYVAASRAKDSFKLVTSIEKAIESIEGV